MAIPVQLHNKLTKAVQGCDPSRKQTDPLLCECSDMLEICCCTSLQASVMTHAQSVAVGRYQTSHI